MAYWLYCQACKQWSKSATPLSDDKSCTYCNTSFIKPKIKDYIATIPAVNSTDVDGDLLLDSVTESNESTVDETAVDVSAELNTNENQEVKEELDSANEFSGGELSLDEESESAPKPKVLKEKAEKKVTVPKIRINDRKYEEDLSVSEELEIENEDLPVAEELEIENEDLPVAEELEIENEDLPVAEELEIENEDLPVAEELEIENENEGNVLPSLEEESIENMENNSDGEELSADTIEETDDLIDDEESIVSEPKNTPAHRLYIEDKRRKKHQR